MLKAINHQPVPRVPVWMMRQAGRSDPEYMAYREKAGLPLEKLFRSPEHAVPISLLPARFGVDAIIMFQDILTPLWPMGANFIFNPGPSLAAPIQTPELANALAEYEMAEGVPFVGETLKGITSELNGDLPVLGFAGAPFTLAAFLIEGHSPAPGMPALMAFAKSYPEAFETLMEKLTRVTIAYLNYQVAHGAHAVQLFESMGDQIPEEMYQTFAQPSHEKIFAAVKGAPTILFVKGSPYPEKMLASGANVLSLAEGVSMAEIYEKGEGRVAVQGNVDNKILAEGTPDEVAQAVRACLEKMGGKGHILNLNHGLLAKTPFENVKRFIETAKEVAF